MADNTNIKSIIKSSFNYKVSQGNLSKPPFELVYDKYIRRDLKAEASFLNKARINIPYSYYNGNKKAVIATILCVIMICLTLYEPSRVFADRLIKKIYVVYQGNGYFKLKQIEVEEESSPQTTVRVPNVTDLNDSELSKRLGYKVVIPSGLPGDYSLIKKSILKAGDNEKELKEFVSVMYSKQNVDISKEPEFISLKITDLKWPICGTLFTVGGIDYYYKESGVAEYHTSTDAQGNLVVDQEKKPKGIDLVHRLAWRINNVTYAFGDVGGRDLTKEQLVEIAKPLVDILVSE